jgi:hypothetical protein
MIQSFGSQLRYDSAKLHSQLGLLDSMRRQSFTILGLMKAATPRGEGDDSEGQRKDVEMTVDLTHMLSQETSMSSTSSVQVGEVDQTSGETPVWAYIIPSDVDKEPQVVRHGW